MVKAFQPLLFADKEPLLYVWGSRKGGVDSRGFGNDEGDEAMK